ncbi:MAG TPA: hypothetical protein VFP10_07320 [Candidatus Eisenbacteria bacterium]|nr:hypothetical protein [Candidatus Eisenbacteria bacterium]
MPHAFLNILSSGLRAGTRAGWSLFVPLVLSVPSYGIYSLFQATVASVTQIAILGTPHTILRQPTRELPLLGLFLHSLSLAVIGLLLFGFIVRQHGWLFYALVSAASITMILYLVLIARTKSRLQFGHVLRSEAMGSAVFVLAILSISVILRTKGPGSAQFPVMAGVEILAAGMVVVSLLSGTVGRLSPRERSIEGTRRDLSSVYSVGVVVLFDVILFQRLEVFFLERSPDGMEGVAAFGLAAQLMNVFLLVPFAVGETWAPRFARSFGTGPAEFLQTVKQKLHVYRRLYVVLVIGSVCATPLLVQGVFRKYAEWTWPITALVAIRILCSYIGFYSATLYASRRERFLYAPVIAGAVIALIANFLFTLRWGMSGAILAYGLTQLSVVAGMIVVIRRLRLP